jgi:hypothetical protein
MASQLFRNLDRLAGVGGATITGERARRDMLTERDLGRSQQSYLQGQRLDTQRQLSGSRQRQDQLQFEQRMNENRRQFRLKSEAKRQSDEASLGIARDRINAIKKKNLYDQREQDDKKMKQIMEGYDETIGELNNQARILSMQKDITGATTKEAIFQIEQINKKIRETGFEREAYMKLKMEPRVLEELNKSQQIRREAEARQDKKYNFFMDNLPLNRFDFGQDGYIETPDQLSEADKWDKHIVR